MCKRTFVVLLICFCVVVMSAFISASSDKFNSERTKEFKKQLEIHQKINESTEHQNELLEIRLELLTEIQEKQSEE